MNANSITKGTLGKIKPASSSDLGLGPEGARFWRLQSFSEGVGASEGGGDLQRMAKPERTTSKREKKGKTPSVDGLASGFHGGALRKICGESR